LPDTARTRTAARAGALALALTLLPACSGDDPLLPEDDEPISEVAEHGGELCPADLPTSPDTSGLGTGEPAPAAPSVATPEDAAVCLYEPQDTEADDAGGGTTYEWALSGAPVRVPTADLEVLADQLGSLTPTEPGGACTDDLGQRWMLVTVSGDDLTGVVVDDFGCGSVRMTDEPFETVPGEAAQEGTVPGVLDAPARLLERMKLVWVDG
jgi:hypothetical protein